MTPTRGREYIRAPSTRNFRRIRKWLLGPKPPGGDGRILVHARR
ncbi:hypothetical protein HMPREF0004_4956 [Achromobacter piechaudii ATCC 43553]|uniref:Uncharacterized protein n=1 Tax=Achromobacter piechaudii ATCC 43553 TaxID=742159 RepID=D4XHK9_9BURK|nr:hypothetical protein HMPREF0004_4956 [Achromobacter piechaudii ATCC 43553]